MVYKAPPSKGPPRRRKRNPPAAKKGSGTPTYTGESGGSRSKAPGRKKSTAFSRAKAFRAEAERQRKESK